MSDFKESLQRAKAPENGIVLFWLEQSHFAFKTPDGKIIHVDPFLSRTVKPENHIHPLPLIEPDEAPADYVFLTHDHRDHTDPHSVGPMARENPDCLFIGPAESRRRCVEEKLVPAPRFITITIGQTTRFPGFTAKAVYSRDTAPTPNTTHLGYIFTFGKLVVYHVGDTRSDVADYEDQLADVKNLRPHVLIIPINRKYSNPGPEGALRLMELTRPRLTIPCHFDCFKDNTLDPREFVDLVPEALRPSVRVLARGGKIELSVK
jgi:L-ascorbate 6-phosphate lactonase